MSVDVRELKRLFRRLGTIGRQGLSKAVVAGDKVLRGHAVNVIGLVYPDGKTINVLVEKTGDSKALALDLVSLASTTFEARLETVAESDKWIQLFGKIPDGVESFALRARRNSRYVPISDGTAGSLGQGHVQGYRSWKAGARWEAAFVSRSIRFALTPDVEPVSILGISAGLGRIKLRLGYSVSNATIPALVTLRARKSGQEIAVPVTGDTKQGLCVIDGASVIETIRGLPIGKSTWDVTSNGQRLMIGQSDIVNPRAVYRFGWIKATSGAHCVKIRPYWTLDRKLSFEMKLTVDHSASGIQ